MDISLPYGHRLLRFEVDKTQQLSILKSRDFKMRELDADPIRTALAAPLGTKPLHEMVETGLSVVIVTSDITRRCPTNLMLPPLLEELAEAGVREEDVTIVFGLGTHRKHTIEEQIQLVGQEIYSKIECIDFDSSQVTYIGTTKRGTPIEVFKPVAEADIKIALGVVEPHYFAGYSGGAKALVPGVCSARTIQHNHAMMIEPMARTGVWKGNPVREDIEEGASIIGLDFILNVVLNDKHEITAAVAGDPLQAYKRARRILDSQCKVSVEMLSDIVVVSAGGHPKDINVYQAHKALESATACVRPGGVIIWIAECKEGFGNKTFEEWMIGSTADEILKRIQQEFRLGGHKAAAIARTLKRAKVWLISELDPEIVKLCGMTPFHDLGEAVSKALDQEGPGALINVLPEGGSVIPMLDPRAVQP